ncbi:uncharacterized protein LOC123298804 [Chrysoperla carnea]|uniref:uncharacterized protein LOC123298804 n=1 Tax=Chrysoperla carnea TaxID=189513 RepID=UPI001D083E64|nr:uncharacterized protein LOC123298804 [Chrysoperla carnea]
MVLNIDLRRVLIVIKDFMGMTSLHGYKFVFERRSLCQMMLWLTICSSGLTFSCYLVTMQYMRFLSSPTTMGIETLSYSIATIPFPAMTLCTNSIHDENAVILKSQLEEKGYDSTTVDNFFRSLSSLVTHASSDENMNPDYLRIMQTLNRDFQFTLETLMKHKTEKHDVTDVTNLVKYVNGAGEYISLKLTLNLSKSVYTPQARSVKALIHEWYTFPSQTYEEATLLPGQHVTFQVIPEIVESSPDVKSFSKSQRMCVFNSEVELNISYEYSYKSCLTECRIREINRLCQCNPYYYPKLYSIRTCNWFDLECLNANKQIYYSLQATSGFTQRQREELKGLNCECLARCNKFWYTVRCTISDKIDYINFTPKPHNITANISTIEMYFKDFTCTKYLRNVFMTWDGLLAQFGEKSVSSKVRVITVSENIVKPGELTFRRISDNILVTLDLIRKRSEHNEGEIGTLEEITLHQDDIEKIEHLGQWCRHLKILLLQGNLISKIENLNKLKELEYLNLAINCIERVENLEGCESLTKLDLSVNFIIELTSIKSLQNNIHLKELFLTGNPCHSYEGYRQYVVATLPQLECLDTKDITRSERIVALQEYKEICKKIEHQQKVHFKEREEQKQRLVPWVKENEHLDQDDNDAVQRFWNSKSEYAPETRYVTAKHKPKSQKVFGGMDPPKEPKKPIVFFAPDGRPYNINQGHLDFHFDFDHPEKYTLELSVYKYLDSDLISVDIETNYVRVKIKEKYFQLGLPQEIQIDKSTVVRSKSNGHLVITMPLLNPDVKELERIRERQIKESLQNNENEEADLNLKKFNRKVTKREYLEIGCVDNSMDFSQISKLHKKPTFVDNPEVPPLE